MHAQSTLTRRWGWTSAIGTFLAERVQELCRFFCRHVSKSESRVLSQQAVNAFVYLDTVN
jgi:hypothetical protein